MYKLGSKRRSETTIGQGIIHKNPSTGLPQIFNPKPCRWCGSSFVPNGPCNLYCTQECADDAQVERYLNRNYKMSVQDWVCMFEEYNGRCCICGSKGFKLNEHAIMKLVVDHDHVTGKVRGLLCHNCNRALGLLGDNTSSLLNVLNYLEGSTTIPRGSTLKRVEAVSIREGDDMVCSHGKP